MLRYCVGTKGKGINQFVKVDIFILLQKGHFDIKYKRLIEFLFGHFKAYY